MGRKDHIHFIYVNYSSSYSPVVDVWSTKETERDGGFTYEDKSFDVEVWKRLGVAINGIGTLYKLDFWIPRDNPPAIGREVVRCVAGLFEELKHNNSITKFRFNLSMINGDALFDLRHFLINNSSLRELRMLSVLPQVTPDHARAISNAIAGVYVKRFTFDLLCEQNESYDQIVSACTHVEDLNIACREASSYSALAALLQNPIAMLKRVTLSVMTESSMDILSTNLSRDTKLKGFFLITSYK